MEVRILGPIELWGGEKEVPSGPPKQRSILAALALSVGQSVPVDALVDQVWGERPPRAVHASIHTYITRLRRLLGRPCDTGAVARLALVGKGYRLEMDPARVDLHSVRAMARQARDAARAGHDASAVDYLREALGRWRGQPLAGMAGSWASRVRDGLARERLDMQIALHDAKLRLGHHADLVSELPAVVTEHPLAEQLISQMMLALYRCGRSNEALLYFADVRRRFREELGTEPGPLLTELHQRMLRQDPGLALATVATCLRPGGDANRAEVVAAAGAPSVVAPRQLPADVHVFCGRERPLHDLHSLVCSEAAKTAVVISVITGTPGVGKPTPEF